MKIAYQKGVRFNDPVWYSMNTHKTERGPRLTYDQLRLLKECEVTYTRKGDGNGDNVVIDEKGYVYEAKGCEFH